MRALLLAVPVVVVAASRAHAAADPRDASVALRAALLHDNQGEWRAALDERQPEEPATMPTLFSAMGRAS